MRKFLFILLIVWTAAALGQSGNPKKIKVQREKEKAKKEKLKYKTLSSFDLAFGEKVFGKTTPDQFKAIDTLKFDWPIKFISAGFSGHKVEVNPRNSCYTKMFLNFIYPQSIRIDSITNKLQGFFYNFEIGQGLSTKKKNLGIIIYAGFNTGVLRLTGNRAGTQFNPFFAPSVSLQPKAAFGPICLSIIINWDYDISNPSWKSFKTIEADQYISGLNQTSFSAMVTMGYRFNHL